jgi:hypothetical protein
MIRRSAGLARSQPPRRKTELARTGFQRPSQPASRAAVAEAERPSRRPRRDTGGSKPLPPRSKKTAKVYRDERVPLVTALLTERPWCEIQWDDGCQGRSVDAHEPRMRSRGADICDPGQCVAACRHCHNQVHANPAAATEKGWLTPSWQ